MSGGEAGTTDGWPCGVVALRMWRGWFKNYSYLIVDRATREAAVVDPSWDMGALAAAVANEGARVSQVLLTHSHLDHTNLTDAVVRRWGARVHMSREEIDGHGFRCGNLDACEDGDVIDVGETKVACLLTPGHTLGGACYLAPGALFTGDTLFSEGCGMCTGSGASADAMFDSVQRIKRELPTHVRVFPGHSYGLEPGRTLGALMDVNIYLSIDDRDAFVGFRMRPNQHGLFDFLWGSRDHAE